MRVMPSIPRCTLLLLLLALVASSCSDDDDTGPSASDGLPLFDVTTVTVPGDSGVAAVALSQPGAELVAVILSPDARLWLYPLDGAASPTEVLSGVAVPIEGDLRVVRGADGTVHVAWQADGDIHHATGQGTTGWSTSVVYAGVVHSDTGPTLAIASDGSVHAAWVGLQSGTWTAFYGTRNGSAWTSEAVRSVESNVEWAAIAVTGSTVLLAGTNQDDTLWLVEKNGGTWVDQPVDLGEFNSPNVGNTRAIAAGPAGVAIAFGSNPRSYAA